MKRILITLLAFALIAPFATYADSQFGPWVKEECYNDTHLYVSYNITWDDGPEYFEQYVACTHNCTNNRCAATDINADWKAVLVSSAMSTVLLGLSIVFGMGTYDVENERKFGSRPFFKYMSFFLGLFIMISSAGMVINTAKTYGASPATIISLQNVSLALIMIDTVFVFLFGYDFYRMVIRWSLENKKRKDEAKRKW